MIRPGRPSDPQTRIDRDLLFGVHAVQMEVINSAQFEIGKQ